MGNRIPIIDEESEPIPPTFAEELQPISIVLEVASSWVLPEVVVGTAALVEILVIPDPKLTKVIDYDAKS